MAGAVDLVLSVLLHNSWNNKHGNNFEVLILQGFCIFGSEGDDMLLYCQSCFVACLWTLLHHFIYHVSMVTWLRRPKMSTSAINFCYLSSTKQTVIIPYIVPGTPTWHPKPAKDTISGLPIYVSQHTTKHPCLTVPKHLPKPCNSVSRLEVVPAVSNRHYLDQSNVAIDPQPMVNSRHSKSPMKSPRM